MIEALIFAGVLFGYTVVGGVTSGYCHMRFETCPAHKGTGRCPTCGWQFLGIIWPLFWLVWLSSRVAVLPMRATVHKLGKPKLPKARMLP